MNNVMFKISKLIKNFSNKSESDYWNIEFLIDYCN